MSIFPIFNASFAGLILVGLFTWNIWLLMLVLFCVLISIGIYLFELINFKLEYAFSFWLFIFSEVSVFCSLLFCCLYYDNVGYSSLSSPLELPFLGCFVLLGSSITVTCYHHLLGCSSSNISLVLTIILGLAFVCLQIIEIEEVVVNLYDTTFYASSLCTVGLHFSHVFFGVIGLLIILVVGLGSLGFYRCSVVVWYWHFVDYVWLFVYTIVYVC